MLTISDYPSRFFNKFASKPGTLESFQRRIDQCIDSIEKGKEIVSEQVKPVSEGANGSIKSVNFPDITTGQPITNFQPFFPSKDLVGSQVKEVSYDAQLAPHPVPYPDITTGGKFNLINDPPAVGKNLNTSV